MTARCQIQAWPVAVTRLFKDHSGPALHLEGTNGRNFFRNPQRLVRPLLLLKRKILTRQSLGLRIRKSQLPHPLSIVDVLKALALSLTLKPALIDATLGRYAESGVRGQLGFSNRIGCLSLLHISAVGISSLLVLLLIAPEVVVP